MRTTLAILTLSMFAACGGDDGPSLGGDVVGSWREIPNATDDDPPPPAADRFTVDFAADGTYQTTEGADVSTGRYTIDGGDLTLTEDGGGDAFTLPYLATSTRFVLGALVPDGSADGFVGSWTGTSHVGADTSTATYTLAADMTAHVVVDASSGMDLDFTGTWRAVGNDVEITFMTDDNVTVHVHASLVEGVLGTAYEAI